MSNIRQIIRRFFHYKRDIKNVWEEYNLINHSLIEAKQLQKNKSYTVPFQRELLLNNTIYQYSDRDIYKFVARLINEKLPQKSLVESVAMTETYLQDLTALVYRDYPSKVTHQNADTPQSQLKLTQLIVNSIDKAEMIEKLIEEKIRGIFYGNPVDFFTKDKAQIGINDFIKNNCVKGTAEYAEIIARRNIIVHNDSNVDSKYIKEVTGTTLTAGQKPLTDKPYLRKSIITLRGAAALSTKLCLENIYNQPMNNNRIERIANTAMQFWVGL
ncbi:MAG: hypothetical protein V9F01_10830 [Chitinophagaceae bacterium]